MTRKANRTRRKPKATPVRAATLSFLPDGRVVVTVWEKPPSQRDLDNLDGLVEHDQQGKVH
jgi:hypothetical protein